MSAEGIAPLGPHTTNSIKADIADAARQTGNDFDYLLAQAKIESSLRPDAQSPHSSARGLYQFIESTWLDTLKRHGGDHGLGDFAALVEHKHGGPIIADPGKRAAALALRENPQIAALMAGALAQDNRQGLVEQLGREPQDSELYLAHFLGLGGASRFLAQLAQAPDSPAPTLFGRAARANRAVFYAPSGAPRSLAGVMKLLETKLGKASEAEGGRAAAGPERIGALQIATRMPNGPPHPQRIAADWVVSLPEPAPVERVVKRSMTDILQNNFGLDAQHLSPRAAERAQRAYARFKALGL